MKPSGEEIRDSNQGNVAFEGVNITKGTRACTAREYRGQKSGNANGVL